MDQYNQTNLKQKIKDSTKGQKITAALYLVTNHLSDNDPMKLTLRTHAVTLSSATHDAAKTSTASAIDTLLGAAVIAGLLSEKNASIISLELRHFVAQTTGEPNDVSALFASVLEEKTMSYTTRPITISNPLKIPIVNENKSKRQDAILSFINERKSASIKDIAALFSDTSEKTIQRELGALVASGKITKRGEKRWSVYMSV